MNVTYSTYECGGATINLMVSGAVRNAGAATVIVLTVTILLPHTTRAASAKFQVSFFSLAAGLTVAADLPPLSRRVLISEAERIWRREGVSLQWPSAAGVDASAPLHVLVIARPEALKKGDALRWPVAELVPQTNRRALAIASIAGAERVLWEATGHRTALLERPEVTEYRLGVVLGRAVAHEIGHYLLATRTHADSGLMRASIDSREFSDPGANTFGLDEAAGDWLRTSLRDSSDGSLPATSFTYDARSN